jgi:nucleoside-diphosphate-sugar epimerase
MTSVLVTGAFGFIGAALTRALRVGGVIVRTASRQGGDATIDALNAQTDWRAALDGVSAVVHCAGPAHARFDAAALRTAVTEATAALAAQAAAAGVKRFVYLSSVKASAPRTYERAVSERDPPAPEDAYGRAKLKAERAVLQHPALNAIVLRPPLVHGPDAKANFALLLRFAASGAPAPFAGVRNKRNVMARASLIEAIKAALAPGPGGVFHVADQPSLSTAEIITALRRGLGLKPNLLDVGPLAALAPAAMTENLESDDAAFRAAYGYGACAGVSAAEALEATARAWAALR